MSSALASTLAARVRQERLRLGWTQSDTAARLGISVRSYQRLELAITLSGLERVLAAFGLSVTLAAGNGTAPAPDPRVARTRQRGVRHARPASPRTAPRGTSNPVAPAPTLPARPASPPAAPTVDPARVAAIAKAQRDRILMAVRAIVSNRLNNRTSYQVVQNVMTSARDLAESDRPAFVAAVVAQLNALNPENLASYGVTSAEFDRWSPTWNPKLGIVDVLAPLDGELTMGRRRE